MRWYWIDRFIEFESGRYAKAVKNVSLAEEHLHDHFPGFAVMPKSLVIEGIAQTGGLLVCEHSQFTEKVVLAKIPHAKFYSEVLPGDTLIYTATIEFIKEDELVEVTPVSVRLRKKLLQEYIDKFHNPYSAADMGQIDEVIEPSYTRLRLTMALEILRSKVASNPPKKHGLMPV